MVGRGGGRGHPSAWYPDRRRGCRAVALRRAGSGSPRAAVVLELTLKTRFALNGFGRIGRALARIAEDRPDLELVAINDLAAAEHLAPALARDSIRGRWSRSVVAEGEALIVDGRRIPVSHHETPDRITWSGATVVVEATGRFANRAAAAGHLGAEVGHVVISANAPDADRTVCVGLNDADLDPHRDKVLSNASCTTNCVAPVAAVLHRNFGLVRGLMTTVHAYTAGQELVDTVRPGSDPRYARAAAVNMIPAATGAARAVALVLPELEGRLDGQAVRVPVANVSMVELVCELDTTVDRAMLEAAFRAVTTTPLGRVLGVTDEPWVSSDALGDPRSGIVDLGLLQHVGGRLVRVVAWYDNEWGYANRLADLVARLGSG